MLITNLWISVEDCCKTILNNLWYFYQLFGYPKTNFGPLTRRQLHSTHFNHYALSSLTQRSVGALWQSWAQSPVKSVYGINWKPSNSEFHALSHCAPLRPWSISNWKIIVALTSRITNTSKMVLLLKVFGVPYQWKHFYTSLSWFEYNHFCHLYVPRTS